MAALVAATHEHIEQEWWCVSASYVFMGGRDKPGHDELLLMIQEVRECLKALPRIEPGFYAGDGDDGHAT